MNPIIVTEDLFGETLLGAVLHTVLPDQEFKIGSAGGESAAVSLARSVLSMGPSSVALVADADTTEPSTIREQRVVLNDELKDVAPPSRFKVVLAIPEIEICFFPDRGIAEEMFGRKLSDEQWYRAQFEPRTVAKALIAFRKGRRNITSLEHFVKELSSAQLALLAKAPVIVELIAFVISHSPVGATTV